MVLLRKLLHLGIYVRCFFKASWSYQKLVSGGSPGGPGGSKSRSWRPPGEPGRRPRGSKSRFGKGKSAQERPRAILEPSWDRKRRQGTFSGEGFGGLGRPSGRLLDVLVALFWVILLRIVFLLIFPQFLNVFGMAFGIKN